MMGMGTWMGRRGRVCAPARAGPRPRARSRAPVGIRPALARVGSRGPTFTVDMVTNLERRFERRSRNLLTSGAEREGPRPARRTSPPGPTRSEPP